MACATFAIAGCGSDTTKNATDNGNAVTWSETFDGTKTDFAVNLPYSCCIHVSSNDRNDASIRS